MIEWKFGSSHNNNKFKYPYFNPQMSYTLFFAWKANVNHFHLNISTNFICHWNSSKSDDKVPTMVLLGGNILPLTLDLFLLVLNLNCYANCGHLWTQFNWAVMQIMSQTFLKILQMQRNTKSSLFVLAGVLGVNFWVIKLFEEKKYFLI